MAEMKPDFTFVPSRAGLPTLLVSTGGRNVPLHSRVDPVKEAEQYAGFFKPGRYDVLVVLGTGLGYHLLKLRPLLQHYRSVICIDILGGVEGYIRENSETSFLTGNDRVTFITGESKEKVAEILSGLVQMDQIKGISVLEHPVSMRLFAEYYSELKKKIEGIINKKAGDSATIRAFGPLYFRNIIKNLSNLEGCRWVGALSGEMEGHTALVVTSGPTLDDHIKKIGNLQERVFIIAVDSALPVLAVHGIRPDFFVSIDPQYHIREHFFRPWYDAVPVLSISVNPLIMGTCQGLISLNTHPLSQVLGGFFPGAGSVDSRTGTVAGDALVFARMCGFSRVGLAGFDFSFPGYSIYARGTAYQHRYGIYFHNRFMPVENRNMQYIRASSGGFRHENRLTRKSFVQYKHAMERLISVEGIDTIFAVNDRGLPLAGVPRVSFDELLDSPGGTGVDKKEYVHSLLSSVTPIDMETLESAVKAATGETVLEEILDHSLSRDLRENRKKMLRKLINNGILR